jgi:hypothetical protein
MTAGEREKLRDLLLALASRLKEPETARTPRYDEELLRRVDYVLEWHWMQGEMKP